MYLQLFQDKFLTLSIEGLVGGGGGGSTINSLICMNCHCKCAILIIWLFNLFMVALLMPSGFSRSCLFISFVQCVHFALFFNLLKTCFIVLIFVLFSSFLIVMFIFTENKIQEATENIAECKVELQQAKRIRKNRQGIFIWLYIFILYI